MYKAYIEFSVLEFAAPSCTRTTLTLIEENMGVNLQQQGKSEDIPAG